MLRFYNPSKNNIAQESSRLFIFAIHWKFVVLPNLLQLFRHHIHLYHGRQHSQLFALPVLSEPFYVCVQPGKSHFVHVKEREEKRRENAVKWRENHHCGYFGQQRLDEVNGETHCDKNGVIQKSGGEEEYEEGEKYCARKKPPLAIFVLYGVDSLSEWVILLTAKQSAQWYDSF